ncbi:hypothetical protein PtB15_18B396 [Puccinia triticina]|nr:hypothetical protein PtB15_18B396 [Puccinia triticina]
MAYPIRGGSINRGGMSNRMEQDRYRAAARAGLSAAIVQSRSATNGQVDRNRIGGQPYLVTSNQNDRRPLIGPVNPQTTGSFANMNHNNFENRPLRDGLNLNNGQARTILTPNPNQHAHQQAHHLDHRQQQPSTRFVFRSNNHLLAATGPYAHLQPQANNIGHPVPLPTNRLPPAMLLDIEPINQKHSGFVLANNQQQQPPFHDPISGGGQTSLCHTGLLGRAL